MQRERLARDQLHKRRFARAVRSEQRDMLAFFKAKRVHRENGLARALHHRIAQLDKRRSGVLFLHRVPSMQNGGPPKDARRVRRSFSRLIR